jgi:hypothetical protein
MPIAELQYANSLYPVNIDELTTATPKQNTGESNLKNTILTFALVLLSGSAWGDWAVKGEGNFSCPEYVSARKTNSAKLYNSISWVQGFVTGVNYQRALEQGTDSLIGQDFPPLSMVNWLETYCHENPQDYLSDAAQALVEELLGKE